MGKRPNAASDVLRARLLEEVGAFLDEMHLTASRGHANAVQGAAVDPTERSKGLVRYYANARQYIDFMRGQLPSWTLRRAREGKHAS